MPLVEQTAIAIYMASGDGALRQGEIVTNLIQYRFKVDSIGKDDPEIIPVEHPFAIVVSQSCDLESDWRSRIKGKTNGLLPNVLFCTLDSADIMWSGLNTSSSTVKDNFVKNKIERFHYFQRITAEQDKLKEGLTELGVDFKQYFSIPTDEVYRQLSLNAKRRTCLINPYLEHFSTRFAYYQYRVALPGQHSSE